MIVKYGPIQLSFAFVPRITADNYLALISGLGKTFNIGSFSGYILVRCFKLCMMIKSITLYTQVPFFNDLI